MSTLVTHARNVMVVGLTLALAPSAQAGHYRQMDEHSHEIEIHADQADRIVRYSFRSAPLPIYTTLRNNLAGISETAHQLHSFCGQPGNLRQIEIALDKLEDQYDAVEHGLRDLRHWAGTGHNHHSHGGFDSRFGRGYFARVDQRQLALLCDEVDEVGRQLECLLDDMRHLRRDTGGRNDHRHNIPSGPVPRVNPVPPVPSRFPGAGPRPADRVLNVPVFRHNGQNFSFSLVLR